MTSKNMAATSGNLFAGLPAGRLPEEDFLALLSRPGLRIERIVSTGQANPPGFWYDQRDAEWVILLRGAATLRFADEPAAMALTAGDWVFIAPGRRHRVERTDADEATVWLAVRFEIDECDDDRAKLPK